MIVVFPGAFPFKTTSWVETTTASAIVGSDTDTRDVSSGNCNNSPRPTVSVIGVLGSGLARRSGCCAAIAAPAPRIITINAVRTLFIAAFPQSSCRPGKSARRGRGRPPLWPLLEHLLEDLLARGELAA